MPDEFSEYRVEEIFVGFVDHSRGKEIQNGLHEGREDSAFLGTDASGGRGEYDDERGA